jgi:hypothetical protein
MKNCMDKKLKLTADEVIVSNANNNPLWVNSNPNHIDRLIKARDNIEKQKNSFVRCWKSCNIYIYSDYTGTGKTLLVDTLFPKAYRKRIGEKK